MLKMCNENVASKKSEVIGPKRIDRTRVSIWISENSQCIEAFRLFAKKKAKQQYIFLIKIFGYFEINSSCFASLSFCNPINLFSTQCKFRIFFSFVSVRCERAQAKHWNSFFSTFDSQLVLSLFTLFDCECVRRMEKKYIYIFLLFIKICVFDKNTSFFFFSFAFINFFLVRHFLLAYQICRDHFVDYYQNYIHVVFFLCANEQFKRLDYRNVKRTNQEQH